MLKHNGFSDLSKYKGVTFLHSGNTYVEENVEISEGAIIEPNVMIKAGSKIGKNTKISFGSYIDNSIIGDNCFIGQNTLIRNNTVIKNNVIIGAHSEISNSIFHNNSGAYHKCIILNAEIHEFAMLGACVITANTKHDGRPSKIIVNKNSKIGVNVNLIAPLSIGENSWVGAGSTITKNVDRNSVVVARCKQKEIKKVENE